MRPAIGTNRRACTIFGFTLVLLGFTWLIGAPRISDLRLDLNSASRHLVLVPDGHGLAPVPTTPDGASMCADRPKFIEEDEDKSLGSLSHLVSPISITPIDPPKILSSPLAGHPPSRAIAVPLRC